MHTNVKMMLISNAVNVANVSHASKTVVNSSDGTTRTLNIVGDGGTYYGAVKSGLNLGMNSAGHTQTFAGSMTEFNKSVSVTAGTLAFSQNLGNADAATVNGGTLQLDGGASFNTVTGTGGTIKSEADSAQDLTIRGAGGTYSGALGAGISLVMDSSVGDAHQIFNGSLADFNGTITVTNGHLTLGSTDATLTLASTVAQAAPISNAGELTLVGTLDLTGYAFSQGTAADSVISMSGESAVTDLGGVTIKLSSADANKLIIASGSETSTGIVGTKEQWRIANTGTGLTTTDSIIMLDGVATSVLVWDDGALTRASAEQMYNVYGASVTAAQINTQSAGQNVSTIRLAAPDETAAGLTGLSDTAIANLNTNWRVRNVGAATISVDGALTLAEGHGDLSGFSGTLNLQDGSRVTASLEEGLGSGDISMTGDATVTASATQHFNSLSMDGTASYTASVEESLVSANAIVLGGSSTLTLGHDNALGSTPGITFAGGTLVYGTGVTTDLSSMVTATGDNAIKVDVGDNEVRWTAYSTVNKLEVSGGESGKLVLGRGSRTGNNTLDSLTINSGTVSLAYGTALKGTNEGSNTIATRVTINGGTLELQSPTATSGMYTSDLLGKTCFHFGETLTLSPDAGKTIAITVDGTFGIGLNNNAALTYDGSKGGGTATISADIGGFGTASAKTVTFEVGDSAGTDLELDIQGALGNSKSANASCDSRQTTLQKTGAGTMRISNINYLGATQVVEGTLIAAHANALGKNTGLTQTVTVGTNATTGTVTLEIQADCSTVLLAGNDKGVITNSTSTAHQLTIGEQSNNTRASSFAGTITGNLGILVKNGNNGAIRNKLTLTGANTYTGATNIWNNAGIYLTGGSIGTEGGNNEFNVWEASELKISEGGFIQNSGIKLTNKEGAEALLKAASITATGLTFKSGTANDTTTHASLTNADITISADYTIDRMDMHTGTTLTLANNAVLTINDGVVIDTGVLRGTEAGYSNVTDGFNSQVLYLLTEGSVGTVDVSGDHAVTIGGTSYNVAADGSISMAQDGKYYVNTTVEYGEAVTANNAYADASTLVMNTAGASLVMKDSLSETATGGIQMLQNGTVTLESDVTLASSDVHFDGGSLTLAGSGTYQAAALSGNTSVANTWDGVVEVSGLASGSQIDFSGISTAGSTVKVTSDMHGTLAANANALGNGNLDLAATLTIDNNTADMDYVIAGNLSGDGVISRGGGGAANFNLELHGDAAEWSGMLRSTGDKTVNFKLNGENDQTVGGNFFNSGSGKMNITFAGSEEKTVSGSIKSTNDSYATAALGISAQDSANVKLTGEILKTGAGTFGISMDSTGEMLFSRKGETAVNGLGITQVDITKGELGFENYTNLTIGTLNMNSGDDARALTLAAGSSLTVTNLNLDSHATINVKDTSTIKHGNFTVGTIGKEADDTATVTSSGSASNFTSSNVTISNAQITYSGAAGVTETLGSALNNSKLVVTGEGKAVVSVASHATTNDFSATNGNAEISLAEGDTATTVGTLEIGTGNTFTAYQSDGSTKATANVTTSASMASGSVANADLVIKGGATLTVLGSENDANAHVGGNLTVEGTGVWDATAGNAVEVEGILSLGDAATIKLSDLAVGESRVLALSAHEIELGSVSLQGVALSESSHVDVVAVSPFGLRRSGAEDGADEMDNQLVATRVANAVTGVTAADGLAKITTNLDQKYVTELAEAGKILKLDVGEEYFAALRAAAKDGMIAIQLEGLDLTRIDKVAFNGYLGTDGADGYAVWENVDGAFVGSWYDPMAIPEPTTGALSVLALAALAARRRRKK